MQFSEQWLRTWVNPSLSTDELSYLLTMAGLEVEEVVPAAPAFSGVVIAEVVEVAKHENADRLRVTKVNVGTGELIQIVCGAPNVAVGVKVPCALPGAVLPGDFKIKPTKMRGVESNGMLCSGKELGIPDDVDGLLILPADAPVGQSIRDYRGLDDQLFTLKITPNRADCLSIKGLAREVAALTNVDVQKAVPFVPVAPDSDVTIPVVIDQAEEACGRYLGRVIKNVNAAASTPAWMKQRLERSGIRSISAIVDVTNYVLLELGQPMHAFDLSKIDGGIRVRMAKIGEQLLCLNEKTVTLTEQHLVIADEGKVLAIAGIMGGEESGVTVSSQDIVLESAFFAPAAIAGKARDWGFGSDSSFRFERGVDFELQREAIERATALVVEICGGQVGPVIECVGQLPARKEVTVRTARINKVLGLNIASADIAAILGRLGLAYKAVDNGFAVQSPSFRFDIEIEEDLIEEVARVYGYDAIPDITPASSMKMLALPEERRSRDQVRYKVAGRDYQEIVSYAFVDQSWEADFANNADPIKLINPIASQMSVMRSTLIGGLIDVLVSNINRKQARVRLFEVARVFAKSAEAIEQTDRVAGLAWGHRLSEQWGAKTERVDFYDVKADIDALLHPVKATYRPATHPALHPGRCAEVYLNDKAIGYIGELHPKWVQKYDLNTAPVVFELNLADIEVIGKIKAQPVSKFQPVRRDLALVVDESVAVGDMLATFAGIGSALVKEVSLFDIYRGKGVEDGKKSLAFRVILQDDAHTLTDEEVESTIQQLLDGVLSAHAAQLRV